MASRAPSSRKEKSHERILDSAARMLRQAGFHGVSVAHVMSEAGLTHGGFYAHFATRDDLIADAVTVSGDQNFTALHHGMQQLRAQGSTPFQALVHCYLSDTYLTTYDNGCIVAALSSEIVFQTGKIRDVSCQRIMSLVRLIEDALPSAKVDGNAIVIASSIVGALQLARALNGEEGKRLLQATRQTLIAQYDGSAPPL